MRSKAQFVHFLVSGTPGILAAENDRLTFHTDAGERLLDVPLTEITGFRPSWVGYGSILVIWAGGKKYALRMTDLAAEGSATPDSDLIKYGVDQSIRELSAIAKGRQLVKAWCEFLKASTS